MQSTILPIQRIGHSANSANDICIYLDSSWQRPMSAVVVSWYLSSVSRQTSIGHHRWFKVNNAPFRLSCRAHLSPMIPDSQTGLESAAWAP